MLKKFLLIFIAFSLVTAILPGSSSGAMRGYVSAEIANLRTGPGTEYELLYTLNQGAELIIYDEAEDEEGRIWYSVQVPALEAEGWIASWLVTIEEEPKDEPSGNTAFVKSPSNLRAGPAADYERIGSLNTATPVRIIGSAWTGLEELWFEVETPAGETGWIYEELLDFATDITLTSTALVGNLVRLKELSPFREGPGLEQKAKSNLPPGSGGRVLGTAIDWRQDHWLEVELLDGRSGWVIEKQTEVVTEWPLATVEKVTWKVQDGTLLLTVIGQGYLSGTPTLIGNPDRIVLDIPYALFPRGAALYSVREGDVLRARLRALEDNKVRLFIDLRRPLAFQLLDSAPGQLNLEVQARSPHIVLEGLELPEAVQYRQEGPTLYAPVSHLSPVFSGSFSLDPALKTASFAYGDRVLYFASGMRSALLVDRSGSREIDLGQPPFFAVNEVYIPLSSFLPVFGLVGNRDVTREVVHLDPIITAIEAEEYPKDDGSVRSIIRVVSSAPLRYEQRLEGESNLLYLTIPRTRIETPTFTSTGILLDVTLTSTMGPTEVKFSLNLGHRQDFSVQPAGTGFGVEVVVDRPRSESPAGRKVVLDPGHGRTTPEGYYDSGAVGPAGTKEGPINLDIALRLRDLLEEAGVQVIMTRTAEEDPSTPDLPGRVAIAEASRADLCLSIHNNSVTDSSIQGTETYYSSLKSLPLASLVQEELVRSLGRKDRGYRIPSWRMAMVQDIKTTPSVLTEVVFISNPEEERLLLDPAFRQKAAEALFRAIMRYLTNM